MKRLLLTCIIAVACNACDPVKYQVGEYYVKNLTPYDLTVVADSVTDDDIAAVSISLGVGDVATLFPQTPIRGSQWSIFDEVFDVYEKICLFDASGIELRRWTYGEYCEHDFFSWNSWDEQRETRHEDGKDVVYYTWTFTILPEDIAAGDENADKTE